MSRTQSKRPQVARLPRPLAVTWLAVAVFCLAGVNAARVAVTLTEWDLWTRFDLPFPLPLRVALGVAWTAILAGLAYGLLTLREWSRRWTLVLFPLYQLYEIGWQLAFTRGGYERGRLPFVLITAIAVTSLVVWILTSRRIKQRFNRERTREENGE